MDTTNLISQTATLSGEDYSNDVWVNYFNDCLDDLSPVAKILVPIDITLTSGTDTYPIPSGVNEIISLYITLDNGAKVKKRRLAYADDYGVGWKQDSTNIILQPAPTFITSGTIKLACYKDLDHLDVATLTLEPVIPEKWQRLLILYASAKAQQQEEELDDKNDFYGDYLKRKAEYALERMWLMEPQNRKYIKQVRILGQLGIQQSATNQTTQG